MEKQSKENEVDEHQIKLPSAQPILNVNAKSIDLELIKDNDFAIVYESQKFIRLTQIRAGDKFQTSEGSYKHVDIVNRPFGSQIKSHNKLDKVICVLKPKSTLITETLARKTQILYSMDNSMILLRLDIKPGDIVVEAGTGSGSLTCALSETLGDSGRLYTFEFNKERAEITQELFANLSKDNVTLTCRDVVGEGFRIEGHFYQASALFLDIPNPWAALGSAKQIMKKHGRICCFSPCIEQVQRTCNELRKLKFKKISTIECLSREYETENNQISLEGIEGRRKLMSYSRGIHQNRGHTGYLTFAVSC